MKNKSKWLDYESWREYGLNKGYDNRNSTSLKKSKNKVERGWYNHGHYKKWLKNFEFNPIRDKKFSFSNFKEWEQYGINNGLNKKYQNEILKSKNKNYRSWCKKGSKSGWIRKFEFQENPNKVLWQDYESWNNYGLEHRFNERSIISLRDSKDNIEKSWYSKGQREGWSKKFRFKNPREIWKDLEYVIEQTKKIMQENSYEDAPTKDQLIESGHSKLAYAISRHHNGFPAFREKLREYMGMPILNEDSQLESLLEDYVN